MNRAISNYLKLRKYCPVYRTRGRISDTLSGVPDKLHIKSANDSDTTAPVTGNDGDHTPCGL